MDVADRVVLITGASSGVVLRWLSSLPEWARVVVNYAAPQTLLTRSYRASLQLGVRQWQCRQTHQKSHCKRLVAAH